MLLQQHHYQKASDLLAPIQADRITTDQAYQLFLLRGKLHLGLGDYQEAVVEVPADKAALVDVDTPDALDAVKAEIEGAR